MADLENTQYFEVRLDTELSVKKVLDIVYHAMAEKGYNPVNQIVGYIMSGDPTYITSHNSARSMIMKVERDEKTLAGGADDNILTGTYLMEPRTYLKAVKSGSYKPEELGELAQLYYFSHNGYYPPKADVEKNKDGTFTIHLYEVVDLDGDKHTATSAWYTVDKTGAGKDDITGEKVDLTE